MTTTADATPLALPPAPDAPAAQSGGSLDELRSLAQQAHRRIDGFRIDFAALAVRVVSLEEKIAALVERTVARGAAVVEQVATVAPAPVAAVERVVQAVVGAACPDHPDAVQSVNGCTAAGCAYLSPVGR